ncbi:hypothetical protein Tco_1250005 [Tanacetum coccineum]
MRRKERVTGNVLDAVIQIISLAIVQNHLATKIKRPSLDGFYGADAKCREEKPTLMKLVSWLNRQMSAIHLEKMLDNKSHELLNRSRILMIVKRQQAELKTRASLEHPLKRRQMDPP